MRMPARGRCGLRMLMELASHFGRGPLQVEGIAQSQGILRKYIHVLMAGLLHAPAGRTAGVRWPRPSTAPCRTTPCPISSEGS